MTEHLSSISRMINSMTSPRTNPEEVCALKTCTAASAGHYEVNGPEAQELSKHLKPQQELLEVRFNELFCIKCIIPDLVSLFSSSIHNGHQLARICTSWSFFWRLLDLVCKKIQVQLFEPRYFVGMSCDEGSQPPGSSASVVQWLDAKDISWANVGTCWYWQQTNPANVHNIHLAFRFHWRFNVKIACNFSGRVKILFQRVAHLQDPVNNSSIDIYMNPLMKTMLKGGDNKLCAKEPLVTWKSYFKWWIVGLCQIASDCWHRFFRCAISQGPAERNVSASCRATQSLVPLGWCKDMQATETNLPHFHPFFLTWSNKPAVSVHWIPWCALLFRNFNRFYISPNLRPDTRHKLSSLDVELQVFKWLAPVMPNDLSQKWLAMHLKCPSGVLDFFTALVFWLKKICISSLYLEASVLIFALTFQELNSLKSQVLLHCFAWKKSCPLVQVSVL